VRRTVQESFDFDACQEDLGHRGKDTFFSLFAFSGYVFGRVGGTIPKVKGKGIDHVTSRFDDSAGILPLESLLSVGVNLQKSCICVFFTARSMKYMFKELEKRQRRFGCDLLDYSAFAVEDLP
jgi:hypothetical protein